MRQQQWRMFGAGVAAMFVVCVAHTPPAGAQDEAPPRVKVQGGPAKKGRRPGKSADAAYEASKRAYEALSLPERKAVQDALVWVADYNGTVDGAFGKRTRDALIAFEKRNAGFNSDGVIDRGEFARLIAAARQAKDAVGFVMVADKGAGIALGLPLKLLSRRIAVDGGTRYASADYGFMVETRAKPGDGDLAALYDKLSAGKDGRTVTYKASKADWFVVSGDTGKDGAQHFYSRFDQNPESETDGLRGYTILYDGARRGEFDRLALAVANSVEPFPGPAKFAALQSTGGAAPHKAEAAPRKPDTAPPAAEAPRPRLTATAVVVASGRAVTVLSDACTSPASGKQGLKIVSRDAASGLAVLAGVDGRPLGAPAREPAPAEGDAMVVVGYAVTGEQPTLGIASGELTAAGPSPRLLAPLQDSAAGSAVFDRNGSFRGLVGRASAKPRLVAGIMPQASYPLLLAEAIGKALPDVAPATAGTDARKRLAGEIAAAAAPSLIAIDCVR